MPRMSKKFQEANTRRHELIDKKFDGGLTEAEEVEYAGLKQFVGDYMAKKFPRDTTMLDEMGRRLDEIIKRVKEKKNGGD